MNILAIGAHHDDIDLGAAGTLAKFSRKNHQIYGIIYSDISDTIEIKKKALLSYQSEVENRGIGWINSFIDSNSSSGFSIGGEICRGF